MAVKNRNGYIDQWQADNIDRIVIKPNKALRLPALLDSAVSAGLSKSRQAYIIQAILDKLAKDGITDNTQS